MHSIVRIGGHRVVLPPPGAHHHHRVPSGAFNGEVDRGVKMVLLQNE